MRKLSNWLKSLCKCNKNCKCYHCRAWGWVKEKVSELKEWLVYHSMDMALFEGLGLMSAAALLFFTGNLECVIGFLLLGLGVLKVVDHLTHWR